MLGTTIFISESICVTFYFFKDFGKKLVLGKLNTFLGFKYKTTPSGFF